MRIAIIGAGVSGLVAAHLLHDRHHLTVFEANDRVGGHVNTVSAAMDGASYPVDTGFVVFNDVTYPNFRQLLRRLGVDSRPTDMSFSVRCEKTGLEYSGTSMRTLFAQRRNLASPTFLRMVLDILRFNRKATGLLRGPIDPMTIGDFVRRQRYSETFLRHYLLPMASAIWSCGQVRVLDFPLEFFLRFFGNHGLLGVSSHHEWRYVPGGARTYVGAIVRPLRDRVRVASPVLSLARREDGVEVTVESGEPETFDEVIVAAHADEALRMLSDASPLERDILGSFRYQRNDVVLHTDATLLPRRRRARASWNYHVPREDRDRVTVTYDMSRLQRLKSPSPFCVTLNRTGDIEPSRVVRRLEYSHPVFTRPAVAAHARHGEISGVNRTHYCGAYWGNGFHEDGVNSALRVCERFGSGL